MSIDEEICDASLAFWQTGAFLGRVSGCPKLRPGTVLASAAAWLCVNACSSNGMTFPTINKPPIVLPSDWKQFRLEYAGLLSQRP